MSSKPEKINKESEKDAVIGHQCHSKALEEDNEFDELPESVLNRINYLKILHSQKVAILNEYLRERVELERRYITKYQPLYETRADIVTGGVECPKNMEQGENKEENEIEGPIGIPDFWVTTILHDETLQEIIQDEDIELLEHLVDLRCIDDEDMKGFTLEFCFSPNGYFTNSILRKIYKVANLLEASEPIISVVQSDKINWKPEKNICVESVTTKIKKGSKTKIQTKLVKKPSFFHFFKTLSIPEEGAEIKFEHMQKLAEELEFDFDQALLFRNSIIPNAVIWFTGQTRNLELLDDNNQDSGNEGDKVNSADGSDKVNDENENNGKEDKNNDENEDKNNDENEDKNNDESEDENNDEEDENNDKGNENNDEN